MVLHRVLHGVVYRNAVHLLSALSWRYPGNDTPASNRSGVRVHQTDVEFTLLAGGALNQDSRIFIAVNHAVTSTAFFTTRSMVSSIS